MSTVVEEKLPSFNDIELYHLEGTASPEVQVLRLQHIFKNACTRILLDVAHVADFI